MKGLILADHVMWRLGPDKEMSHFCVAQASGMD